jgi:hypothetical protein
MVNKQPRSPEAVRRAPRRLARTAFCVIAVGITTTIAAWAVSWCNFLDVRTSEYWMVYGLCNLLTTGNGLAMYWVSRRETRMNLVAGMSAFSAMSFFFVIIVLMFLRLGSAAAHDFLFYAVVGIVTAIIVVVLYGLPGGLIGILIARIERQARKARPIERE